MSNSASTRANSGLDLVIRHGINSNRRYTCNTHLERLPFNFTSYGKKLANLGDEKCVANVTFGQWFLCAQHLSL